MSAVFVCSYMDGERRATTIDDPEDKSTRVRLVLPQMPAWLNSAAVDFTIRGPSSGIRPFGIARVCIGNRFSRDSLPSVWNREEALILSYLRRPASCMSFHINEFIQADADQPHVFFVMSDHKEISAGKRAGVKNDLFYVASTSIANMRFACS